MEPHVYAKIFRQIFDSSIAEKPELRFTFMDLLVLADSDGVVDMTREAIARITNRPLEIIRSTIIELEGPDPMSRTPDSNGARIKRLDDHRDWGWVILNFDKFRQCATDEQRRVNTRERVRKHRESSRNGTCNAPVTQGNASVTPPSASASASACTQLGGVGGRFQPPTLEIVKLECSKIGLPNIEAEKFVAYYESNGWKVGRNPMKRWQAALIHWRSNWQERNNGTKTNAGNRQPGYVEPDYSKGF